MTTQPNPPAPPPPPDAPDPPWLAIARAELGVAELAGEADNPRIVEYLKATHLPPAAWHDATAHCAAFVSWVLLQAKLPSPRTASARAFLKYGQTVPINAPHLGAIAVFSRGADPAKGHVALWIDSKPGTPDVLVLGANQGNRVCIAHYARSRLLGVRWPAGVPLPAIA